ncbi:DUF2160 domain-containing protein [Marinobacterium sp. D7]|uniref:DUF2160 domain-containing protein n=1 Tax=Marinobacterium ramblicola TaxID=2849041 RepID=UPI001C2D73DB|nr:DUF2160 domain-containing protein [Marinobacterium ramblicola]
MSWMAWTLPVAVFFSVIACILICMTVYEVRSPCVERRGFLPIATTRGDRLFIGLLSSAYVHLVFLGLTDLNLWIPLALSVIWLAVILRWG